MEKLRTTFEYVMTDEYNGISLITGYLDNFELFSFSFSYAENDDDSRDFTEDFLLELGSGGSISRTGDIVTFEIVQGESIENVDNKAEYKMPYSAVENTLRELFEAHAIGVYGD